VLSSWLAVDISISRSGNVKEQRQGFLLRSWAGVGTRAAGFPSMKGTAEVSFSGGGLPEIFLPPVSVCGEGGIANEK
jgi:hypothetical protein